MSFLNLANMFNSFYQSVFNKIDINNKCSDVEKCKLLSSGNFQITIEEVRTILKSLDKNKSSSPDKILLIVKSVRKVSCTITVCFNIQIIRIRSISWKLAQRKYLSYL